MSISDIPIDENDDRERERERERERARRKGTFVTKIGNFYDKGNFCDMHEEL